MISLEALLILHPLPPRLPNPITIEFDEATEELRLSVDGRSICVPIPRPPFMSFPPNSVDISPEGECRWYRAGLLVTTSRIFEVGRAWGKTTDPAASAWRALWCGSGGSGSCAFFERAAAAAGPRHGTLACGCMFCGDPERLAVERDSFLNLLVARTASLIGDDLHSRVRAMMDSNSIVAGDPTL